MPSESSEAELASGCAASVSGALALPAGMPGYTPCMVREAVVSCDADLSQLLL